MSGGGPAFPTGAGYVQCGDKAIAEPDYPGMTLRDYFAAKAMQSLVNNPADVQRAAAADGGGVVECVATCAYEMADAMLEARKPK